MNKLKSVKSRYIEIKNKNIDEYNFDNLPIVNGRGFKLNIYDEKTKAVSLDAKGIQNAEKHFNLKISIYYC